MPFVFTRLLTTGLSVDRSVGGRVCYVERKMACYDAGAVCKGLSWSHHGGGVLAGLDRLIWDWLTERAMDYSTFRSHLTAQLAIWLVNYTTATVSMIVNKHLAKLHMNLGFNDIRIWVLQSVMPKKREKAQLLRLKQRNGVHMRKY